MLIVLLIFLLRLRRLLIIMIMIMIMIMIRRRKRKRKRKRIRKKTMMSFHGDEKTLTMMSHCASLQAGPAGTGRDWGLNPEVGR